MLDGQYYWIKSQDGIVRLGLYHAGYTAAAEGVFATCDNDQGYFEYEVTVLRQARTEV